MKPYLVITIFQNRIVAQMPDLLYQNKILHFTPESKHRSPCLPWALEKVGLTPFENEQLLSPGFWWSFGERNYCIDLLEERTF